MFFGFVIDEKYRIFYLLISFVTHLFFYKLLILIQNGGDPHLEITVGISLFAIFFPFPFRDLLLPDGNRVSAFSVASTAIAAAQWSSSQVGPCTLNNNMFIISKYQCLRILMYTLPFRPQQSSEGMSEYTYLQEGYTPASQVSRVKKETF